MIWLTWRQFRLQAWVGLALLAVLAGVLLATAPRMFDLYEISGLQACTAACADAADVFTSEMDQAGLTRVYVGATALMYLFPALIGVFWGAPLVARELESGTHRLVWSQTVSRGRWIGVKLAGGGLAVVLLTGLTSVAATWWAAPMDQAVAGRVTPLLFAARGVVPLGYAAFAFVAGVLIGLVARRTVLAMAVTLLLVALVQVAVPMFLRPAYSSPVHATVAFDPERIDHFGIQPNNRVNISMEAPVDGAWVLARRMIDSTGAAYSGPVDPTRCGPSAGFDSCPQYLAGLGLQQEISYVPAERFWTLQWRELGLFTGLTVLLSLAGVWWVRRRVV
jgi:ABC-type transport system involved in multi-copper enzyme maturation permease subunit